MDEKFKDESWGSRQTIDDNFRKIPGDVNAVKTTKEYRSRNDERSGRRYEGSPMKSSFLRQGDNNTSEHKLYNLEEEKTSDEDSVTEIETNDNPHGDVCQTYHQCDSCGNKKYDNSSRDYSCCANGKCSSPHRTTKPENRLIDEDIEVPQKPQQGLRYKVTLPEALIAMKQLERLKELQRRRDYTHDFYSNEIQRFIGENFHTQNAAIVVAPTRNRGKISSPINRAIIEDRRSGFERARGGGFSKEVGSFSTMTTTTHFDCGCIEETTIPIYNKSIEHVQKCKAHRYQEQRGVSKLASSPHPQELSYRIDDNDTRIRNSDDCETCGKLNCVSRDHESWDERRTSRNRKSPRNLSPVRATSPAPKYSDTESQ